MGRHSSPPDTGAKSRWRKRRLTVAVFASVFTLASGTAYAYWTTVGTGVGAGTAGTNTPFTVAQDSAITGMAPGSAAKDVDFTISNSAANPQRASTVTITKSSVKWLSAAGTGTGSTLADHPAGATAGSCSLSDFTVTPSTITVNQTVAASSSLSLTQNTTPQGAQISLVNTGSNQDDCKTATVALAFAVS
jgi:hypothetical protein